MHQIIATRRGQVLLTVDDMLCTLYTVQAHWAVHREMVRVDPWWLTKIPRDQSSPNRKTPPDWPTPPTTTHRFVRLFFSCCCCPLSTDSPCLFSLFHSSSRRLFPAVFSIQSPNSPPKCVRLYVFSPLIAGFSRPDAFWHSPEPDPTRSNIHPHTCQNIC